MTDFCDRYQHGFYQEVYDDLMALGEHVFDDGVVEDAHAVATHLMKRVRYNLEIVLIPRLQEIGYRFGDGSWDHRDMLPDDELKHVQLAELILQVPPPETAAHIARLQEVCGSLPLSLTAWYTEVGAVNLIGAFAAPYPSPGAQKGYKRGYGLDPLFTEPLPDVVVELGLDTFGPRNDEESIPISPDGDLKYGYSGGGDYEIAVPCKAFDGMLVDEPHHLTFIQYLRLCLRWGGLPGLEQWSDFPQESLRYLTQDLIPF